jgi:hypothetical protein
VQPATCAICGTPNIETDEVGDFIRASCPVCGQFAVRWILWQRLNEKHDSNLHLLSGYFREQSDDGAHFPRISTHQELETVLEQKLRVPDKARKFLAAMLKRTDYFEHQSLINSLTDYPLGYCAHAGEFASLIGYLIDRGFVRSRWAITARPDWLLWLTAEGLEEAEHAKRLNVEASKAFVAMSFDDSLKSAYEAGLFPGIRGAGYAPFRSDMEEFNGDVMAQIMAETREARFLVADFTLHSKGVYFEAGFAHGLGLPVICTCRNDHVKGAHFDTNHLNHIVWETPAELKDKLNIRIRATIGQGPLPVDSGEKA